MHCYLGIVEAQLLAEPAHRGRRAPRGQHDVDSTGPQALDGGPGPGRHVAIRTEQCAVQVESQQARLAGSDHGIFPAAAAPAASSAPPGAEPGGRASAQTRRSRLMDASTRRRPAAASNRLAEAS